MLNGVEMAVFLSYRKGEKEGEDELTAFVNGLCSALKRHHLRISFVDGQRMVQRGEFMDEVIGAAMEGSRIFLPIFSKSYADCKSCLSEVAKMLEFKGLILPIFYDVQPSQVGNQTGPYEIAFEKHENDTELNQDRVVRWRTALKEAGKIKGFVVMSEAETGYCSLSHNRSIYPINGIPLDLEIGSMEGGGKFLPR